jgi:hypothetical protein
MTKPHINVEQNVPDNTIVAIKTSDHSPEVSKEFLDSVVSKPSKKRDWFPSRFYRCLPLTIGNQYGFLIKSGFDFSVFWDGSPDPQGVKIELQEHPKNLVGLWPSLTPHFGQGILTVNIPFMLRTPPGINLMTINPPNYVIPNVTVMTGVVETDNLRRDFSLNLKLQMPDVKTFIPKGSALAAVLPIPRYFVDKFSVLPGSSVFTDDVLKNETKAAQDAYSYREIEEPKTKFGVGQHYLKGTDVYKNLFKDHQRNLND